MFQVFEWFSNCSKAPLNATAFIIIITTYYYYYYYYYSIHPSIAPWLTTCRCPMPSTPPFSACLDPAPSWLTIRIFSPPQSLMSSNHSRYGLPRLYIHCSKHHLLLQPVVLHPAHVPTQV